MPAEKVSKADYIALENLHKAQVEASQALEQENYRLVARNEFLEAQLVNLQKALDIQKDIMINAITKQNENNIHMGKRVVELKRGSDKRKRARR